MGEIIYNMLYRPYVLSVNKNHTPPMAARAPIARLLCKVPPTVCLPKLRGEVRSAGFIWAALGKELVHPCRADCDFRADAGLRSGGECAFGSYTREEFEEAVEVFLCCLYRHDPVPPRWVQGRQQLLLIVHVQLAVLVARPHLVSFF